MAMTTYKVLLTDYAWDDLEIERNILASTGAELRVAPAQDEATLAREAADCDAILTCWARVSRIVIEAAPRCRIVSRLGIGLDNIDLTAAAERGMYVTNVPDYCQAEVAEHTLALLLALGRKVAFYHAQTKQGVYDIRAGAPLRRIAGQTLGLIGLGSIGAAVAERAAALGINVLAYRRCVSDPPPRGVSWSSFDDLLATSDYVSLHVPLTPETQGLIGRRELALMRPTAYLINTSRGGLIDHEALSQALSSDRLAGAALDVQAVEPPDLGQMPYCDPRVIVTPHAAFSSAESLQTLRTRATSQVVDVLQGRVPAHVVVRPGG
jgi:D-3-phosphoglycerate dehydrogenase / 2-oxoglutarate reductase